MPITCMRYGCRSGRNKYALPADFRSIPFCLEFVDLHATAFGIWQDQSSVSHRSHRRKMASVLVGIEVDDGNSSALECRGQIFDRKGTPERDAKSFSSGVHLSLKAAWIGVAIAVKFDVQSELAQRNCQSDRESPAFSRMPARLDDLLGAGPFSEIPKNHPNRDWSAISFEPPKCSRTLSVTRKIVPHFQTRTLSIPGAIPPSLPTRGGSMNPACRRCAHVSTKHTTTRL